MKRLALTAAAVALALGISAPLHAAEYTIDTKGAHASISFQIQHLGYSWLKGRFNTFDGTFTYDAAKPQDAHVNVTIDAASVDTNHAERNKHLRSADFLETDKFPEAKFVSTAVTVSDGNKAKISGDFTLHGVTKAIVIDAVLIGEGKDPWGGYRAGFEGKTVIALKDFNVKMDLGPASSEVEIFLSVEGVRQ